MADTRDEHDELEQRQRQQQQGRVGGDGADAAPAGHSGGGGGAEREVNQADVNVALLSYMRDHPVPAGDESMLRTSEYGDAPAAGKRKRGLSFDGTDRMDGTAADNGETSGAYRGAEADGSGYTAQLDPSLDPALGGELQGYASGSGSGSGGHEEKRARLDQHEHGHEDHEHGHDHDHEHEHEAHEHHGEHGHEHDAELTMSAAAAAAAESAFAEGLASQLHASAGGAGSVGVSEGEPQPQPERRGRGSGKREVKWVFRVWRGEAQSKRAEQNRKAQQNFRKRREEHIKELENKIADFEQVKREKEVMDNIVVELKIMLESARMENAGLRSTLLHAATQGARLVDPAGELIMHRDNPIVSVGLGGGSRPVSSMPLGGGTPALVGSPSGAGEGADGNESNAREAEEKPVRIDPKTLSDLLGAMDRLGTKTQVLARVGVSAR